ncbi:MAG: hypothetical protein U0793_30870 [Gemmataceae bacterium]
MVRRRMPRALKKMLADLGAEEFGSARDRDGRPDQLGAFELSMMTREGISPEANARLIALLHAAAGAVGKRADERAPWKCSRTGDKMEALSRLARDAGTRAVGERPGLAGAAKK